MRLRRGRVSLREKMTLGLSAQRLYAAGVADDDPRKQANAERLDRLAASIAPKRHYVRRPVDGRPVQPLEKDIQKACLHLLRVHPKVAAVWRQNSGTFTEQNQDGSMRYISAHTMPGLPDILGFLKDGGRMIAFEVKRPGGKATPLQQSFIERARSAGAIAAVITDPSQILEFIP